MTEQQTEFAQRELIEQMRDDAAANGDQHQGAADLAALLDNTSQETQ